MTEDIQWKDFEAKFINMHHDAYTRRMLQDVVDDYRVRGMDNDLRRVLMYEATISNGKNTATQVYQDPQPDQHGRSSNGCTSSGTDRRTCGASPKQKAWMLRMLEEIGDASLTERYTDEAFDRMPWSKETRGSVQQHIDFLRNRLGKVRADRAQKTTVDLVVQPVIKEPLKVEGIYVRNDLFYRVVQHPSGRLYAKVWDDGQWITEKGAIAQLTPEMAATAEDAKQWADVHHTCCFCRLPLSDDRSEKAGYGPRCAEKYGLPWGQ